MTILGGRLVLHWRASRLAIALVLAVLALALGGPDAASAISGLCAR